MRAQYVAMNVGSVFVVALLLGACSGRIGTQSASDGGEGDAVVREGDAKPSEDRWNMGEDGGSGDAEAEQDGEATADAGQADGSGAADGQTPPQGDGGAPPPAGEELPSPVRVINVSTASQLANALASAQPGDHIVLADGTYPEKIKISRSGTSTAPIVIRAKNVLAAKLPACFEYAPDTVHVWLWGIDFKDARNCNLRGKYHKIRRCRFWPKPDYAPDGWSAAVVPENGSDAEISYCELRMHTRQEALAENPNLWGNNTVYGVIWAYYRADTPPFYRLKIARCLLTGGPSGVDYSRPNSQFIEAGGTPSYTYNLNVDWTIQDCYGDVPRDRTLLDFKAWGFKLLRSHIISPSTGAIQLREGRDHRIERCRLTGFIEVCRGPGNVIANTITGAINVLAGNAAYNQFSNPSAHGQAYRTVIANTTTTSALTVGRQYGSDFTYPALETLIEQHTGSVSYGLHQGTTVRPTLEASGVMPASPVTMTANEVGPLAPWVGVEP